MTKKEGADLRKPFAPLMPVIKIAGLQDKFDELIRLASTTTDDKARIATIEAEIESLRSTIKNQGAKIEQAIATAHSLLATLTGDTTTTSTALKGRSKKRTPLPDADKKTKRSPKTAKQKTAPKTDDDPKKIPSEEYDELTLNLHRSLPRDSDAYKEASRRMADRIGILNEPNWQFTINHIMSATSGMRFLSLATRIYLRTDPGRREEVLISLANATAKSLRPWSAGNLKAAIELRTKQTKTGAKTAPPPATS